MSWVKRRSPAAPNTTQTPQIPMYNPNQHSTQQGQWQSQNLQPSANNWYNPPQQPQQKQYGYGQAPPQQQQQPQYWQQNYNQQAPENAYAQNTMQYNQYNQDQRLGYDGTGYQQQSYGNTQYVQEQTPAQQPTINNQSTEADAWNWGWGDEDNSNIQPSANNANINSTSNIADSFTNDKWDWNVDDNAAAAAYQQPETQKTEGFSNNEQPSLKTNKTENMYRAQEQTSIPPVRNLALDHLTATGKRNKIETLTPQWSIESQMSQDSSDDILHTSESDKSHMLSRSSTVSQSPISGHDTNLEANLKAERQSPFEYDNAQENREIVSQDLRLKGGFKNPTPPLLPPPKGATPPLPQGSSDDSKNPYKRNAGLSHKMSNRFRASNDSPPNKGFYQNAPAFSQSVNLETLPDNSEHPDYPQQNQRVQRATPPQWQENVEVAPINDRNQYLETGQLSDVDLHDFNQSGSNQEVGDTLPPPGLRREVLGQMEQNAGGQPDNDEPPPGLSRYVLGQTQQPPPQLETSEPPLHRMVPGESSSPETIRQQGYPEPDLNSHIPQTRSATIGADTPPSVSANRSETIGSDTSENRIGADGLEPEIESSRRESIEGQPEETDINNLASSVRNLNVRENPTDTGASSDLVEARKSSRQESSDSERDPRDISPGDRRYPSKEGRGRGKSRERFSPDEYKDKRYERRRYRERRYDDDTEYYSEKEREQKSREDYDRKYNSLRRDKEKDRRRTHREYGTERRHGGRGEYYYDRYDDDYDSRSRPSSRSDSMHENYRERAYDRRHRDRDHEREHPRRRHRDHHNYMQMYGYDPYNPYYQQYQYYENLRRTNPQAYAEWYRKYYQQTAGQTAAYGSEDRASVHSGRSSANGELDKDRYTRQSFYSQASLPHMGGYYRASHSISGQYGLDMSSYSRPNDHTDSSINFEETTPQRLTPAKFATAHIKASISSGNLVKIPPHYPLDGQIAAVEFGDIQTLLLSDDELKELVDFPGPLVKGVTHKKTIIEYCENKIRHAFLNHSIVDRQSYVLMWELLILLIRQNGMVVGADIAELLMKERQGDNRRPSSVLSDVSNELGETASSEAVNSSSTSVVKEEVVTNKFREYLLHGSGKEALEWAMKHGLWGHALFLASKLDKRTYANVMMRFANGLTMNDPLQTLYQLLSGRLPAAVTCVADEKWGDWKPHLAMILSNTTQRPELDRKAITTLGDTLFSRGSLYAAQFCYLMAQVEFSRYGNQDARLVLLGANHTKSFREFATNDAIHMTEIYEYACSLNDGQFVIQEFQAYKYLLASRLADRGLLEKALAYLERIAIVIIQNPSAAPPSLVNNVCKLGDRLKFYDLAEDPDEALNYSNNDYSNRPDNTWLKDLNTIQKEYNMGLITHQTYQPAATPSSDQNQHLYEQQVVNQDNFQQVQYEQQQFQQGGNFNQQWNVEQQQQLKSQQEQLQNGFTQPVQYQETQQYWPNQQLWSQTTDPVEQYNQVQEEQQKSDYWNNAQNEPEEVKKAPCEDASVRPQISMPNQAKGHSIFDEDASETAQKAKKDSPMKPKPVPIKQDKPATTGWFGGIWSKLALRPKNQMKLPDDKNPTIVWDSDKKRWVNLEEEGNEGSSEIKPPPKMSDMFPKTQPSPPPSGSDQVHAASPLFYNTDSMNSLDPYPSLDLNIADVDLGQNPAGVQQNYKPQLQGSAGPVPQNQNVRSAVSEDAGLPPKPSQPNMFKLQRNRNLKKSYVDVFNPGGKSFGSTSLPALDTFGAAPQSGTQMNFFVPQPVSDPNAPTDFLTPAPTFNEDGSQMSRWSSASSLSREVQSYMRHKPPLPPR